MTDLNVDSNGRIDLEGIVEVLADEEFEVGKPAQYFPAEGRVLKDAEDGTVYVADGNQWLTVSSDTGMDLPSVTTEAAVADHVSRGAARQPNMLSTRNVWFDAEFIGQPLTSGYSDAEVFHRNHFDDDEYRVIVQDGTTARLLYRTPDFESYTQVSSNIVSGYSWNTGTTFQDHVVLDDGTFVLYEAVDDSQTDVWTGEDLTNLSKQGTVVANYGDCGAFREPQGTIHIYPEGDPYTQGAPTTNVIKHFTTSSDDLLSSTQQSNVIDVSGKNWHTGDVDVCELNGYYWMFMDRSVSHPNYNIAVARSQDLYEWEIVSNTAITDVQGGDLTVTRRGGHLEGLVEFAGTDSEDIGHFRLTPRPRIATELASSEELYWNIGPSDIESANLSSSGSASDPSLFSNGAFIDLSTGATADSHAAAIWRRLNDNFDGFGWGRHRVLSAAVRFNDTEDRLYVVTGKIGKDDKTGNHVGVAMKDGDIIGTVGNGSSETTTTLISGASADYYEVRAELYAEDHVDFYVNDSLEGSISSGLPDGVTDASRVLQCVAENAESGASDRQLRLYNAEIALPHA